MIPTAHNPGGPDVAGLLVADLYESAGFDKRKRRRGAADRQMDGLQRLADTFVVRPEAALDELARAAVDLCGADSAGVTLQTLSAMGESGLQWVAVAGEFARFNNACFPYVNTACGTGIERGRPQHFRMDQRFYDRLGIEASPVTDGILIPWRTGTVRGTVWIMAHGRSEAFDANDARLMETLASFAAMAFRQRRHQRLLVEQASQAAAAAMANELAHGINNPLQALTNLAYLAGEEASPIPTREIAEQMAVDLERLATLVRSLLALPVKRHTAHITEMVMSSTA